MYLPPDITEAPGRVVANTELIASTGWQSHYIDVVPSEGYRSLSQALRLVHRRRASGIYGGEASKQAIPPRPTRRSGMRRADRKKPSRCSPPSPSGTSPGYTAEQREQLHGGLRILARMIVRAHLRGEIPRAASPSTKPPSEKGFAG